MTARFIIGDSLTVLRSLPDASVDLWLTSSPFLALRSYLPPDHPDKALEVGQEPTPGEFIDTLLDYAEEARRVLAPHGSMVWELGDTYAGSGGAGGDYGANGLRNGQPKFRQVNTREHRTAREGTGADGGDRSVPLNGGPGWPLDKSLCLIPELFRIALVYGFNPLTGRTTPRWRARNVVRWCRPNPPVGALADKVRPATSDMVVACMSRRRYFDLDVIRSVNNPGRMDERDSGSRRGMPAGMGNNSVGWTGGKQNPAGAPPLDHWWHDEDTFDQDAWLVSTEPYKGSHYATWPTELCVKPIEAMCPRRVCRECGKPSERIVDARRVSRRPEADQFLAAADAGVLAEARSSRGMNGDRLHSANVLTEYTTLGWSDCGHGSWRPGVTLDPFAGSGTTLAVATGHGRDAIGIDLDERNAELAARRVGMWLEVERFAAEATA